MKVLIIADIHGRTNWQFYGNIEEMLKDSNKETMYDKYIFLGDYVDSWTETDAVILNNLEKLISLKKAYPDKIILLLGNHDLQYMFSYKLHGSSGYRPNSYQELHKLFNDNKDLFLPIYQIDNYLFTHAGITTTWIRQLKEKDEDPLSTVMRLWNKYDDSLFRVGWARNGSYRSGGPFWADMSESKEGMLPNYHQIVGHHPTKNAPLKHVLDENSSITYVDNNETGQLELNIPSKTHITQR